MGRLLEEDGRHELRPCRSHGPRGEKIVNSPWRPAWMAKAIYNGGQTLGMNANGRPQSVYGSSKTMAGVVFRYRHVWLDGLPTSGTTTRSCRHHQLEADDCRVSSAGLTVGVG